MAREIDILVADGASTRIGKAVLNSLRRRGLVCEAIDDEGCRRDEFGYLRLLKATLEDVHPKILLPVFQCEWILMHRNEIPGDMLIPSDSLGKIRLLDDKVSASALCSELGILQPKMYTDGEAREYGFIQKYPVVFKLDSGLAGSGVYFTSSWFGICNMLDSANARGHRHLIMDYIEGYDVSVDAVRWDGYFQASVYKTLKPRRKGTSLVRLGIDRPDLVESVRKILDRVDYHGACGVDFRIGHALNEDIGEQAYFMECNPRLCGGIKSALKAGFDIPWTLWQLCCGQLPESRPLRAGLISAEIEEMLGWKQE